ncbi:MAG TPA: hypothetical protein VGX96_14210 [Candidatus Elarobacter sp.]|jgi:hypothetical protein|nr:hypothetical protein [Candidatus Elarobacter sp.]
MKQERTSRPEGVALTVDLAVRPADEDVGSKLTFLAVTERGTTIALLVERLPPPESAKSVTVASATEGFWRVVFERLPDTSVIEVHYYWQVSGTTADGRVCYVAGGPARLAVVRR